VTGVPGAGTTDGVGVDEVGAQSVGAASVGAGDDGAGRPGVVLVVPAALRDDAGGVSSVVVVTAPATGEAAAAGRPPTVRQVLDALAVSHPRLERRVRDERGMVRRHVNVFVGADDSRGLLGQDTPVPAGAEVLILPNVSGG
jgi:molybdopterin synthase sulfur carrier subunit